MNVAMRRPMTMEEFLAWEDRQELRYEFDGSRAVAMVGGTEVHSTIQFNLVGALHAALRGKPCRGHGSHLKVEVAGRIRYPDAFVVCSPAISEAKVVRDPVVLFEILSPTTSHIDLVDKNEDYRDTPSVQRYVVLEQTHAGAVVFSRKGEDWVTQMYRRNGTIDMPEIGISLAMADIYEGLELLPDDAEPEEA